MGRKWTKKEVSKLKALRKQGKGWLEISKEMNKTSDQVRMYWRNNFGETNATGKLTDPEYLSEHMPVIGIFDVETLPILAYSWGVWDQNLYGNQIIKPTCMLSWAGKILNHTDMHSDILTPKEIPSRDTARITKSCWEFLDKCDVVVGHNLIGFDKKIANSAFLLNGLPPIHYKMVDTLKIARKNFKFYSNKMKELNKILDITTKIDNDGFPLWRRCDEGDEEALAEMLAYNEGDIYAGEDLYYILRPYMKYFNAALYNTIEERQCRVCGSTDLTESKKFYMTPSSKWKMYRCNNCTALSRGKENLTTKRKRKLLINALSG